LFLLNNFFQKLHSALPDNVRLPIDIARVSISDTLHNWRLPAHYVTSDLPENRGTGSVLYLGDRPQYKSWTNKLLGTSVQTVSLGKFSLHEVLKRDNGALIADITICPVNPWTILPFAYHGWHIVPLYVLSMIDLTKPLSILLSRDACKEVSAIRKFSYTFCELRSEEALEEYYQTMLKPTAMQRHGSYAFLSDFENLRFLYARGFILAAYIDSEWVGARLVVVDDKRGILRSANIGWRSGDEKLIKKRIVAALNYELIKRASEQGFVALGLGSSDPFANDGSLNYKLKWGANIELPKIERSEFHLQGVKSFVAVKFNLTSPSAQSILHHAPLFEKYDGRLRIIGWNSKFPPPLQRQIDSGIPLLNLAEIA
jgi:hypothetical protein